jgi:hypothetical protein
VAVLGAGAGAVPAVIRHMHKNTWIDAVDIDEGALAGIKPLLMCCVFAMPLCGPSVKSLKFSILRLGMARECVTVVRNEISVAGTLEPTPYRDYISRALDFIRRAF